MPDSASSLAPRRWRRRLLRSWQAGGEHDQPGGTRRHTLGTRLGCSRAAKSDLTRARSRRRDIDVPASLRRFRWPCAAQLSCHNTRGCEELDRSDSGDSGSRLHGEPGLRGPAGGAVVVHLRQPNSSTRHRCGHPLGHLQPYGRGAQTLAGPSRRRAVRLSPERSCLRTEAATCRALFSDDRYRLGSPCPAFHL